MDVMTQQSLIGWTLLKWSIYFSLDASRRKRIFNVISLEASDTKLGEMIQRPEFVCKLDLVDLVHFYLILVLAKEGNQTRISKSAKILFNVSKRVLDRFSC